MSWFGIMRLGLVQAALGSVVVLITSTLNRVMVIEYALPAMLPGLLVALHYSVQMLRPRFGYGSDRGARRTPWILGGMAALSIGGVLCAVAAVGIARNPLPWLALAIAAYALVGMGVSAAGTSLLALLAKRVDDRRRAAAATIMWVLMIAGFAVTSGIAGHFLDPFSPHRLIMVTACVAAVDFAIAVAAVWNVENGTALPAPMAAPMAGPMAGATIDAETATRTDAETATRTDAETAARTGSPRDFAFGMVLRQVWSEPQARRFTLFVFTSMLAYSAQELLLEPFAGRVFGYTVGESSRLSGMWHGAVLIGLVAVGVACSGSRRFGSLRTWTIGGCIASACALLGMACAGLVGPHWPLRQSVAALGLANGVFAVGAIGSMMELAHRGEAGSAGLRMGLWGAAQAIAFALGGFFGTFIVDAVRYLSGSPVAAFAIVFGVEAVLFLVAAGFAVQVDSNPRREPAASAAALAA